MSRRGEIEKEIDESIIRSVNDVAIKCKGVASIPAKGIKLSHGKKGLSIAINANVNYGCRIPEAAWDIQENVKHKIEELYSLNVTNVDIYIQGVE